MENTKFSYSESTIYEFFHRKSWEIEKKIVPFKRKNKNKNIKTIR